MKDLTIGDQCVFLAKVSIFKGSNAEESPLVLEPIAGTSPRPLNVVSHTFGNTLGVKPGDVVYVKATYAGKYKGVTPSFVYETAGLPYYGKDAHVEQQEYTELFERSFSTTHLIEPSPEL